MSKQILPVELAEIVSGLLVCPEVMGELDSLEKHRAFMRDIGEVVAQHCGGDINDVHLPMANPRDKLAGDAAKLMLSVSPGLCVPDNGGVWAWYDPQGWEGELNSEDREFVVTPDPACEDFLAQVRGKIVEATETFRVTLPIQDWRIAEDCREDMEEGDDAAYTLDMVIGQQTYLDIQPVGEAPGGCIQACLEIDCGVPTLHMGDVVFGDNLVNIRSVHDGLVLTPASTDAVWKDAPVDRYSYAVTINDKVIPQANARVLRDPHKDL